MRTNTKKQRSTKDIVQRFRDFLLTKDEANQQLLPIGYKITQHVNGGGLYLLPIV